MVERAIVFQSFSYKNILLLFFLATEIQQAKPSIPPISSFVYQLQNLDLEAVGDTEFDLIIMDYSSEGDDASAYSADEIASLKNSTGGQKIILSYLSIGEAEDYRFYWQENWEPGNPVWLDEENKNWKENYKVHYWEPAWQAIVYSYLDRILSAGFHGAYLDIIDAYEAYQPLSSIQSGLEMVRFVRSIREYARDRDPDFLVFVQNAAELADPYPEYLDYVDGIGQEDLYYGYEGDGQATPLAVTRDTETALDIYLNQGKIVLTVDYPFSESEHTPHFDQPTLNKIHDVYTQSRNRGYIPYCTVRDLDYLTIIPEFETTAAIRIQQPDEFRVYPVSPNPFNQQSVIRYRLSAERRVTIRIVNIFGKHKMTADLGCQKAGLHRYVIEAASWESGIYFCQLTAGKTGLVMKMVLVR